MFLIAYNLKVYLKMLLDSITYSVKTSVTMSVIYLLNAFSLNAYLCGYTISLDKVVLKELDRSFNINICALEYLKDLFR